MVERDSVSQTDFQPTFGGSRRHSGQLRLHPRPHIFNGIQIRGLRRPIGQQFHHPSQLLLGVLSLVTRCIVLHQPPLSPSVELVARWHKLLQSEVSVHPAVQGLIQEEQGCLASPRNASPHHHLEGTLSGVPDWSRSLGNPHRFWPFFGVQWVPKHFFVREQRRAPLVVRMGLCEGHSAVLILLGYERSPLG